MPHYFPHENLEVYAHVRGGLRGYLESEELPIEPRSVSEAA